ncbi:MAG TPA: MarR family transcriptional regulator, partial [Ilumatobacteraceae bacterium]
TGMAMVTSVMRAQQILLARVHQALAPYELTFAQYEALMLLTFSRKGQLPLGKMGRRLQVHPASVTNVIDRLEAKGLVARVPHPVDNRTTLAAITRAGRSTAAQATKALNADVFAQTGLDDDDQDALIRVLTALRAAAGDFTP